jgi:hypothetical protein
MFVNMFVMSVIVIFVMVAIGQGIYTIASKSSKK